MYQHSVLEPNQKMSVPFILKTYNNWVSHIRRTRHIGDFSHWKDHNAYQTAFDRLLRDQKANINSRNTHVTSGRPEGWPFFFSVLPSGSRTLMWKHDFAGKKQYTKCTNYGCNINQNPLFLLPDDCQKPIRRQPFQQAP